MAEISPGPVRVSTTSLGYNLCMALFGGRTPMMTVILIKATGIDTTPALYIMLAAAISLLVVLRLEEPSKRKLD